MHRRAATIPEVLVLITVGALVLAVGWSIVQGGFRATGPSGDTLRAIGAAQRGLAVLTRELRQAAWGADGSYPILLAEDVALTYLADVDADDTVERVRYTVDGARLLRGVTDPTGDPSRYRDADEVVRPVIHALAPAPRPLFEYYDEDRTLLPAPARLTATTHVRIRLPIDADPLRPPEPTTVESAVTLRNLRTE